MRIWIVNHYLNPPTRGGLTRHHHLARELMKRGHEVLLIGAAGHHLTFKALENPTHRSREERVDGVNYHWIRIPTRGAARWSRFIDMIGFAVLARLRLPTRASMRPDVVIGSSPHPFGAFAAQRLARYFTVPFVYEVRDLWPATVQELGGYAPAHPILWLMSRLNRHLVQNAVLIVSLLVNLAEHLRQEGLVPRKLVYVPNGVDPSLAHGTGRLTGERAALTVIYAGNHGLANGLDSILDCARILAHRGHADDFLFRFIGQGAEKARLRKRASRLGLTNLRFEGPVSKNEIFDRLAQADVLIATLRKTSFYRFGASLNKIYDYLLAGKPIVFGGQVPQNPVRVADAGLIVPPEDPRAMAEALLELKALPASNRAEMGRRGKEFALQHCTVAQRAVQLESALLELSENGDSPS